MRRLLFVGLIALALLTAGCGGRGTSACKDNTQCQPWQYCNTTSGACATMAGYCDADAQCRDNMTTCDVGGTHLCVYKEGMCRTSANCQSWQVCDSTLHCRP